MTPSRERLPFTLVGPADPMRLDRLRRRVRRLLLGLRALLLAPLALLRRRRTPPAPSRVARILVVRTDRLGDMALTTAALADLRAHFRRAEITVLAPAAPLALLQEHPCVDRRIPLTDAGLPRELAGRFDLAIDFSFDAGLRGALLVRRSGAPWRAGLAASGREVFFNLRLPRALPGRHVVDLSRDLVAAVGATPGSAGPRLYLSPAESGEAQARLATLGAASPRVVIHPGACYPSQRWSPERFAELISLLTGRTGAACIVLTGPGEETLAARICAATPDALSVGAPPLRKAMALIGNCDLFIGNNSGPLHIAGALGIPTVSVMGPTDAARFHPCGPADRVVRRELACSPCARGRCWHHTCLRLVEPQEVLVEAEAILNEMIARREAR
jgi:lipopolysaccharide heptosyltransferase II